jgi:16S rRNA processing protein RimM
MAKTPPASVVPNLEGFIEIGRIVAPQGLRGEMRVYPDTDFPERFLEPGDRWLLRPGATRPEVITLEEGRYLEGKGLYVIQIVGVGDRSQAEQLRGAKILIVESDRPPLAEGEYHIMDLVGLEVFHAETGEAIGEVISLSSAGNDLLEIRLKYPADKTVLVPMVREFIQAIDLSAKRLDLLPIKGLLPDFSLPEVVSAET